MKKTIALSLVLTAALGLAACGGNTPVANAVDNVTNVADNTAGAMMNGADNAAGAMMNGADNAAGAMMNAADNAAK